MNLALKATFFSSASSWLEHECRPDLRDRTDVIDWNFLWSFRRRFAVETAGSKSAGLSSFSTTVDYTVKRRRVVNESCCFYREIWLTGFGGSSKGASLNFFEKESAWVKVGTNCGFACFLSGWRYLGCLVPKYSWRTTFRLRWMRSSQSSVGERSSWRVSEVYSLLELRPRNPWSR